MKQKVKFAISTSLFQSQVSDLLPCNKGSKSQLIWGLLKAYGLLDHFDYIINNPYCSMDEICQFHDSTYVKVLLNETLNCDIMGKAEYEDQWIYMAQLFHSHKSIENDSEICMKPADLLKYYNNYIKYENIDELDNRVFSTRKRVRDDVESENDEHDKTSIDYHYSKFIKLYNLEGDCPIFSFIPLYLKVTSGATLRLLDIPDINLKPITDIETQDRFIGINWDGGRHHAMKRRASGFCYFNDIVLLIQRLRKIGFRKITYLDFDLHHGDGVEKAMVYSKNVQTVSLHLYEIGFFPCSGSLKDSRGNTTITLPVNHGLDDETLDQLTDNVIHPCIETFKPEFIIIQCGSDGLIGDKFHEWQLTIKGLTENIIKIVKWFPQCHVILLGGGGYNVTLASRFYSYLTWTLLNEFGDTQLDDPFKGGDKVRDENGKADYQSEIGNVSSDDIDDYDILIPDHEYIELYGGKECYKFWIYEQEGTLLYKPLKNDNSKSMISIFKEHYNLNKNVSQSRARQTK